ncbi:MAG: hypothetical protein ABI769_18550, partial [Pseudomonadota bacterium]
MLLKAVPSRVLAGPVVALIWLVGVVPAYSGDNSISVVGAIESVGCKARTIKVLGITFAAIDAGNAAAICRSGNPADLSFVAVTGTVGPTGNVQLTKIVGLSANQYVPGATPVYLRGRISGLDLSTGAVFLSGAVVSQASADLGQGSVVEILGTQPTIGGVVLPATIRKIDAYVEESVNSSIGSGASVNSSIGSGASLK